VTTLGADGATTADPPVQLAIAVFDDTQPTVTVPVKPFTEVMVTEAVLPVVALPPMLILKGETAIVKLDTATPTAIGDSVVTTFVPLVPVRETLS
jgi:hypothetical protein